MKARDRVIDAIRDFDWRLCNDGERIWMPALADAVMAALDPEPFHVMEVRRDGWTLKHPLSCRVDLFNCPTNRAAENIDGQPAAPGRYHVGLVGGTLVIGEEIK